MTADLPGLGRHPALAAVPPEEVRFGVVLNGGVSLAVWMGGAALELDRLVKALARGDGPYATMLRLAGCTARVDVVSGTSAGGVNGAALALAQVNRHADLASLRDVWVEQGRIEALLRQPFRGAPSSLLKGDDHFLPQLNAALTRLAVPADPVPPADAPIDLTVMTTVLGGNQRVTVDALGQRLPQSVHGARFRWRRPVDVDPDEDPFGRRRVAATAAELALAARSSSSFPVAFEPSWVPVGAPVERTATTDAAVRPDLAHRVEEWGDPFPARDRSRFVVDGGVLANTPTRPAVAAIERMPAEGAVRRVMLLVHPHAPEPGDDPAHAREDAPTLTATLTGVLGALSAQGSRTFVEEIEQHNVRAAGRRGTRGDVLEGVGDAAALEALATGLFEHYRRLRMARAARDLALRRTRDLPSRAWTEDDEAWDFDRVRAAAESAQRAYCAFAAASGVAGADAAAVCVPYVPAVPATADAPEGGPGWGWGVSGAVAVGESVNELLRELVWVLPAGEDVDLVRGIRRRVTDLVRRVHEARAGTDDPWEDDEVLTSLRPDDAYWTLRLASYDRLMKGAPDALVRHAVDRVAAGENERRFVATGDKAAADAWERTVRERATAALLDRAPAGAAGALVRDLVEDLVAELARALPALQRHCVAATSIAGEGAAAALGDLVALHRWATVLRAADPRPHPARLLTTLLHLEVASATIGDETGVGTSIPIELVQLSAQTDNAFARYSRTGDDKLGGWSVKRFGGFLKRSWRVNDWTWGRIDAATVLCRTVLHPARVRRAAYLSGYLTESSDPRALAEATVRDLVADVLGETGLDDDPRVCALRTGAVAELTGAFTLATPTARLSPMMPALAHLVAWGVHLELVAGETVALTAAIREDRADGASARSRGELFLAAQAPLLDRAESVLRSGAPVPGPDRVCLLDAFDRAGVGREPLTEESASDLMIRNASTAGAVSTTVLDSPSSGLGVVRPVTRLLRGAMLVVHWTVVGLTSRAVIPRTLALLGLAIGGVLLLASLVGVLPPAWSGPAALVGGGCLLAAFGFSALRTGTLLHGLVLLTPVVPLLTWAFTEAEEAEGGASALRGGITLTAMAAVTVGLVVLGSIPAAYGSVWLALGSLADRRGVPHVDTRGAGRWVRLTAGTSRRARGLVRSLPEVVRPLLVLAVPALLAWWVARVGTGEVASWLVASRGPLTVLAVVVVALGAVAALFLGDLLRPATFTRRPGDPDPVWDYGPLAHPAGVNASWAVLYGAGYLVLGLGATWLGLDRSAPAWLVALVVTALLLGVGLGLLAPVLAPLRVMRELERAEVQRDRQVARFVVGDPLVEPGRDAALLARWTASRSYAVDLAERGVGYRWVVSREPGPDRRAPCLTARGTELLRRLDEARLDPPSAGWRWRARRVLWWVPAVRSRRRR